MQSQPQRQHLFQKVFLFLTTHNVQYTGDTEASYTLIHESLWKELTPQESLQPWTSGPLHLPNGEAEAPLGWISVLIKLHNQSFPCSLRAGLHLPKWSSTQYC